MAIEPKEKAASLPEKPGVYLFRDASEHVIYVGKARALRNRVRSYFVESRWQDRKTGSLARETELIKQYKPKFNVMLRDDKTYPYIKFTAAEKYLRVYFTRRIRKDG